MLDWVRKIPQLLRQPVDGPRAVLTIASNGMRYTDLNDALRALRTHSVTVLFPGGDVVTDVLSRSETVDRDGGQVAILYNYGPRNANKIATLSSHDHGEVANFHRDPLSGQVIILFTTGVIIVSN